MGHSFTRLGKVFLTEGCQMLGSTLGPLQYKSDKLQYSCRAAMRVARRGLSLLASDSGVTRKLRTILRDHLANAQNHLSNARRESDMLDLYNLNNLARKACCKNVSC